MIENENQFCFGVFFSNFEKNFDNFFRFSLFQRFKILEQSSIYFNIQYRRQKIIESMINEFFYHKNF